MAREIKVKFGPFKALGIWFTEDLNELVKLNFTKKLEK